MTNKKLHYFIGQKANPYHLSVGAVLVNSRKEIACHHFKKIRGKMDVYTLMRNTVKPNESLEDALARGLKKEFGMKADVVKYLGSIVGSFVNWEKAPIQKTTLYFLCKNQKVIGRAHGLPAQAGENLEGKKSIIVWRTKSFLIKQMQKQGKFLNRTDMDEAAVLRRI